MDVNEERRNAWCGFGGESALALMVTSIGTILPSVIYSVIIAPYLDPSRDRSARRRSPAVFPNIQLTKHIIMRCGTDRKDA